MGTLFAGPKYEERKADRMASQTERDRERERYARGLPDYHDPLAGFGGAPPAQSALTARLVFASLGVVLCVGGAVVLGLAAAPLGFTVVLSVLAAIYLVDLVVIVRRKLRGEPG
jgi:hypothetical protein